MSCPSPASLRPDSPQTLHEARHLELGLFLSRDRQRRMRSIRAFRVTTATTRCTLIRSAHAEARRPRGNSPLRPRARSVSHDKASLPALGLNRGGVRFAFACPRLRTGPSIGRGFLLGLPCGSSGDAQARPNLGSNCGRKGVAGSHLMFHRLQSAGGNGRLDPTPPHR